MRERLPQTLSRLAVAMVITGAVFLVKGAQPVLAEGNPTIRINGFECGLLDADGNPISTTNSRAVLTREGGNTIFSCEAEVPPFTTERGAVRWNIGNTGYQCGTLLDGLTGTWEEVITPDGRAKLICLGNPSTSP